MRPARGPGRSPRLEVPCELEDRAIHHEPELFGQRCTTMRIDATSTTAPSVRRQGLTPRAISSKAHTTRATIATTESTDAAAPTVRRLTIDATRNTARGMFGSWTMTTRPV